MSDEPHTPAIDPPLDRAGLGPLRIHHLLTWAALPAILFVRRSGIVALTPFYSHWEDAPSFANAARVAVPTLISGGQLMIAYFALLSRWRRSTESIEPGEWISIYDSAQMLVLLCGSLMSVLLIADGVYAIVAATAIVVFALRFNETRLWKVVMVLVIIPASVFSFTSDLSMVADSAYVHTLAKISLLECSGINIANLLLFFLIPIAFSWDLRKPRRRAWTHWLGVGLWLTGAITELLLGA